MRGKEHFFWGPKPGSNLHSGDTLALKKWLSTKRVDIFMRTLISALWKLSQTQLSYLNWWNTFV